MAIIFYAYLQIYVNKKKNKNKRIFNPKPRIEIYGIIACIHCFPRAMFYLVRCKVVRNYRFFKFSV